MIRQSASHLLMIEPRGFVRNTQTASDNAFQKGDIPNSQELAIAEHREFRNRLIEHGVVVTCVSGRPDCPDDIFCNNWISNHVPDRFVLYPMKAENRRSERRADLIRMFTDRYSAMLDLSGHEKDSLFLEGTGSMVLDHVNRIAYVCVSDRSDETLVEKWCEELKFSPVVFRAEIGGAAPYHTNVLMYVGTKIAGVCLDAITSGKEAVAESLKQTGHDIVELSTDQIGSFCGNALEVSSTDDRRYLVMSSRAFEAMRDDQLSVLRKHVDAIIHSPLNTIEDCGGGSARCCLLELF